MFNNMIGNTPMIKIIYEDDGKKEYIYAKLEYYNFTGSIKDRVAYYIINNAKKRGELKDGMPIVEATSGNTGISLAALGRYYKHEVYIFMPDWASSERIKLLKSFGANVILISKEDGGFIKCVEEAKKEIIDALPERVSGFVSGVGTGGTLMGIGKRLKEANNDLKVIAIEPEKMPIISKGKIISRHKIEGIGDDFAPDLIDKTLIDNVFLINDDDAVNMSRKLARDLGIGVGISSGANLIGSILARRKLNGPIVTVFADDNKKYLSTDLGKAIVKNEKFVSNSIELKGFVMESG